MSISLKVLKVAVPIVLSHLLYTVQGLVSIFLVSPLGKEVIAGVGFASTLLWFVYAVTEVVYTGVNVLVAQNSGKKEKTGRVLISGFFLSVVVALPMVFWGEDFFRFFLSSFSTPEIVEVSLNYLRPVLLFLPFLFITNVINAGFTGVGKTNVVFLATLFVGLLNVALSAVLIYGLLGFPALGVKGAGWAVAVSESLGALFYLPFLLKEELINPVKDFKVRPKELLAILRLGLPTGIDEVIQSFSYNFFFGLIATCGTSVLAAFQIGLRLESFAVAVGIAFSYAATTLVGQEFGAGDFKGIERSLRATLLLALSVMSFLGILIGVLSEWLVKVFTKEGEVVYWAVRYLLIVALSQPFMAVHFVLSGALKGLGKTYVPLAVNTLSFWTVRVLPSLLLLKFYKTPYVLWGAMTLENMLRALAYGKLWEKFLSCSRLASL